MPQPIRVLWLIKGLDLGGAEQLLISVAKVADHTTFRYTAAYVLPSLSGAVHDLEAAGVATHCLGSDHHLDLRWSMRLRRLLCSEQFDILHTHLPYVQSIGTVVARTMRQSHRPRLVYTQHNMWHGTRLPSRLANRLTLGLNDATIAVSQTALEGMPRRLRRKAEVVIHGVPIDEARVAKASRGEMRATLGISPDEVLITAISNFRPEKGHDVLLSAARRVIDQQPSARFVVIGHGPLESRVRAMHRELRLGDKVQLLGLRRDVFHVLAASDIYVLSSLHEGFPVSVMEALVTGVPIVTTEVGGVPDAVADGVEGLIVPPGRADLLAAAISTVVGDEQLRARMAQAAQRRGQQFDVTVAVRRMEKLYLQLAS